MYTLSHTIRIGIIFKYLTLKFKFKLGKTEADQQISKLILNIRKKT